MNVYDFAPDLDLSKEVEGFIFGVRGIGGSDGIVYAAIEGEQAAPWAKACGCRWNVGRSRAGTVCCGTKKIKRKR